MLKGHVFKRQVFGNQIFALFIDTFLDGKCGISNKYGEKMQVTYNTDTLYVSSGCACIKGRFLEEDTSTEIIAGTDTAFCKLVIEIDLDKENTDTNFLQASYKIVKSISNYPILTQNDVIVNNSGIYQFELAQFKTSTNGITNFVDKRTYLDFESIFTKIENEFKSLRDEQKNEYKTLLNQLQQELINVEDGSAYILNSNFKTIEGSMQLVAASNSTTAKSSFANVNLPIGFSQENTVLINIASTFDKNSGFFYGNGGTRYYNDEGGVVKNVNIADKIYLEAVNDTTTTKTLYYKVVLMRTK